MFEATKRLLMGESNYYDIPSEDWFQSAREQSIRTPDIAKLEEYEYQLLFACDETQTKHLKHTLIEDGNYVCPAFTQASFNYWLPETPFMPPVPMEGTGYGKYMMPNAPPTAKIKGELHAIRPYQFKELDRYKENGVQFIRRRVKLIVPYRAVKWLRDPAVAPFDMEEADIERGNPYITNGNVPSVYATKEMVVVVRAHMYIGIPEYWDKLISAFDYKSVQTYQSKKNRQWCQQYYQLRK